MPRLIFCQQMARPTRPPLPQPSIPLVSFIHFLPPEVRRLLERLNMSKATVPDTISLRVLKECSKELAMSLTKLFALCFHTGVQPCRHVEDRQRCSNSQALIQSRCLQQPASIIAVCHVKGDGDHYQQAAYEPSGLP